MSNCNIFGTNYYRKFLMTVLSDQCIFHSLIICYANFEIFLYFILEHTSKIQTDIKQLFSENLAVEVLGKIKLSKI